MAIKNRFFLLKKKTPPAQTFRRSLRKSEQKYKLFDSFPIFPLLFWPTSYVKYKWFDSYLLAHKLVQILCP